MLLLALVNIAGCESAVVPQRHPEWTLYTNANYVLDMALDKSGHLWAVGEGGAVQWDTRTGSYVKYTPEQGLADVNVRAVAFAADGALWFGTNGSGVSRFDGQSWTTYTTEDGLAGNSVWAIAEAHDGALWFGTGLMKVDQASAYNWFHFCSAPL